MAEGVLGLVLKSKGSSFRGLAEGLTHFCDPVDVEAGGVGGRLLKALLNALVTCPPSRRSRARVF